MCLYKLDDTIEDIEVGWQLMEKIDGEIKSFMFHLIPKPEEELLRARSILVNTAFHSYRSGFHIFCRKVDAIKFYKDWHYYCKLRNVPFLPNHRVIIRKVYPRGKILAKGMQDIDLVHFETTTLVPVIVSEMLYIPKLPTRNKEKVKIKPIEKSPEEQEVIMKEMFG